MRRSCTQGEIEAERQRVAELEEQVAATDKSLQEARKKVKASARGAAAGQASQQSQLRTLENRLETVRAASLRIAGMHGWLFLLHIRARHWRARFALA